MTFDLARPRYTLPFAGKDYELVGTMALIEAAEYALKKGIGDIVVGVVNGMPTHELVRLLSAILTACEHKLTTEQVGDAIWNVAGVTGDENNKLRLHLYAFLSICIAPPEQREKKARDAGEIVGKLEGASRGKTTRKRA